MYARSTRRSAVVLALVMAASGLVVALGAAPAQAAWTDASGITRVRVCKESSGSSGWIVLARARKRAGTPDARVGVALRVRRDGGQRWSSGWLGDREVARGWVRTRRPGQTRVVVSQEAGDRDSSLGTALEREVFRLSELRRC